MGTNDDVEVQAVPTLLWVLPGAGIAVIILYSFGLGADGTAISLMVAGAAFMGGVFVGFLFGVPKSLQGLGDATEPVASNQRLSVAGYRGNTSLEQISDWLTKILVGVTLTQLPAIGRAIGAISSTIASDLGGETVATFTGGALVFFVLCGFLIGYLWTRIRLFKLLKTAELQERAVTEAAGTLVRNAGELQEKVAAAAAEKVMKDSSASDLQQRVAEEAARQMVESPVGDDLGRLAATEAARQVAETVSPQVVVSEILQQFKAQIAEQIGGGTKSESRIPEDGPPG